MGNTHTKLLAGAFSTLAVAQFFMVSSLSSQVNQFTENATASIVAAAPMRVRLERAQSQKFKSDLNARDIIRIKTAIKMRSAAGAEPSETAAPTDRKVLKGPNGRQILAPMFRLFKPSNEEVPTEESVETTDVQ